MKLTVKHVWKKVKLSGWLCSMLGKGKQGKLSVYLRTSPTHDVPTQILSHGHFKHYSTPSSWGHLKSPDTVAYQLREMNFSSMVCASRPWWAQRGPCTTTIQLVRITCNTGAPWPWYSRTQWYDLLPILVPPKFKHRSFQTVKILTEWPHCGQLESLLMTGWVEEHLKRLVVRTHSFVSNVHIPLKVDLTGIVVWRDHCVALNLFCSHLERLQSVSTHLVISLFHHIWNPWYELCNWQLTLSISPSIQFHHPATFCSSFGVQCHLRTSRPLDHLPTSSYFFWGTMLGCWPMTYLPSLNFTPLNIPWSTPLGRLLITPHYS